MPSIAYKTELSVKQPWLIETKSLLELDAVVDTCIVKMREQLPSEIEAEVNNYVDRYESNMSESEKIAAADRHRLRISTSAAYLQDTRGLTVFLSGGRTAEAQTFDELIGLPHVHTEVPRGFRLRGHLGQTVVNVKLDAYELSVTVAPEKSELSLELFGLLQNWVTEIQPSKWLRKWYAWKDLIWFLLFLWIMLSVYFTAAVLVDGSQQELRQQGRELVARGIDSSNQARAIGLILAIESQYEPPQPGPRSHLGVRFWSCFVVGCLVLLVLGFPPKGAIGLWGGRSALKRQRNWVKLVSVSIPSLIVTRVALPWLLRRLHIF
jgi:hypothetical protein